MLERAPIDIATIPVVDLKAKINDWLWYFTEGLVQSGPFKGMRLLAERTWDDANIGTELLGTYEQELHGFIEDEIKRLGESRDLDYDLRTIVNLGCAEGYYAVGFARRLPNAIVWAFDISAAAMEITKKAAQANEVKVTPSENLAFLLDSPDLVICDCEGGEVEYLDKEKYPGLACTTIMVECHGGNIAQTLVERFRDTHSIWLINEGPRDPNQFEFMHGWPSAARWIAVSEGRPCLMCWLIMRPK